MMDLLAVEELVVDPQVPQGIEQLEPGLGNGPALFRQHVWEVGPHSFARHCAGMDHLLLRLQQGPRSQLPLKQSSQSVLQ